MNTKQFLVLGLILIVIVLLFNNKNEPFHINGHQINIENVVNELETILCLMVHCPHCQKFKSMSDEQIKLELGIPHNIKFTKVVHDGPNDTASQSIFTQYGVNSAPTLVIHHPDSKMHTKVYPSKEMILEHVQKLVNDIKNKI